MLAEVVVTLFLFAVVMMITAVLFGGWLIVAIIRVIFRIIGTLISPTPTRRIVMTSAPMVTCPNGRCRGPNPLAARFCRRCGVALPTAQQVTARRVATW